MNRDEKLELNRQRQRAVRAAWSREKELCLRGQGTVNWTRAQQRELLSTGRVSGYEGQHMKSVSKYPQYAGDPNNIQLLTHKEHLAAHNYGRGKSGYLSPTNGYYDPSTQKMHSFGRGAPQQPEAFRLSSPCRKETERTTAQDQKQNRSVSRTSSHNNTQQKGRSI